MKNLKVLVGIIFAIFFLTEFSYAQTRVRVPQSLQTKKQSQKATTEVSFKTWATNYAKSFRRVNRAIPWENISQGINTGKCTNGCLSSTNSATKCYAFCDCVASSKKKNQIDRIFECIKKVEGL